MRGCKLEAKLDMMIIIVLWPKSWGFSFFSCRQILSVFCLVLLPSPFVPIPSRLMEFELCFITRWRPVIISQIHRRCHADSRDGGTVFRDYFEIFFEANHFHLKLPAKILWDSFEASFWSWFDCLIECQRLLDEISITTYQSNERFLAMILWDSLTILP